MRNPGPFHKDLKDFPNGPGRLTQATAPAQPGDAAVRWLRFNTFVAIALTTIGLVWFVLAQLRPKRTYAVLPPGAPEEAGAVDARPDEAAAARGTAAGADIAPEGAIVEGAAGEDNPGAVPEAAAAVNPGPGEADGPGETTARSDD